MGFVPAAAQSMACSRRTACPTRASASTAHKRGAARTNTGEASAGAMWVPSTICTLPSSNSMRLASARIWVDRNTGTMSNPGLVWPWISTRNKHDTDDTARALAARKDATTRTPNSREETSSIESTPHCRATSWRKACWESWA